MEIAALLSFGAIAFALIVVPGPDWAYVLAAGARHHVVVPAVGGIMTGYLLITAFVVAGVGPLVAAIPAALTALTVAGSAYLLYLGYRTLRSTGQLESTTRAEATTFSARRLFARGVVVSGLNPKGLLLFLAVLPQFAHASGSWPLPVQLATLGMVFVLLTAVLYLPLGYTADRVLGARPGVARVTTCIAGVVMVVMGLALLIERFVQLIG